MTDSNELNGIEQRLSEAFKAHAESVHPSPQAYARLADAVNANDVGLFRRWGFESYFRPLGFVAATIVAFGLGGYVLTSQGSQAVESANGAPAAVDPTDMLDDRYSAAADEGTSGDSADDSDAGNRDSYRAGASEDGRPVGGGEQPSSTVAGGEAIESDPDRPFEGLTYAPVGETRIKAAESFLRLLGVSGVEIVDTTASADDNNDGDVRFLEVRTPNDEDGGAGELLTTLEVAPMGEVYVVERATTDEYDFDFIDPIEGELTKDDRIYDPVNITDVDAVELTNGDSTAAFTVDLIPVASGSERFGFDGPTVTQDTQGASRVWVVISAEGEAGGIAPFSAKPAYYIGSDDQSAYTVVGLPPNDPDGGVVLRDKPNGERIGVIRLGSSGITRRTLAPRLAGDRTWWAVTAPNGTDGWVAADFLAPNDPIDESTLIGLGNSLRDAVTKQLVLTDVAEFAYPVYVGSIIEPWELKRGLDVPVTWAIPREFDGQTDDVDVSLWDFYGADRWAEVDVLIPENYLDPAARRWANAMFGDLPSVVIESINPEIGGRERVHVFVANRNNAGDANLSILAVVLEREPTVDPVEEENNSEPSGPTVTVPEPDPLEPIDRATLVPEPD